MGAAPKIIDKKTLQLLVPFNALSPMHFNEVAQKTVVEEIRAGRLVFKEGERDNQSVYLLEGEISLLAGNEIVGAVAAGSDAARHPVAQQQPRQVSARAKSNVVVARIDSSLLDIMLTWDQSSGYEVAEISDDDDDDWMTRILQSQTFLKLPPSNIQRLLMRVESVPVSAGEVIIRQGGDGDYFYIIKNGRCMVTRRPSPNAKEVKLAELADGDAFGEDALVSDAKRNATITMMSDGVLMRLAKNDFVELLKEPLLAKLNYPDAAAKVAKGAEWLDVRLPGEYENVHIRGSRNIPLSALRLEANGLNPASKFVVCCDTGRRSASAAFVLSQRGFEVFVLNEGLTTVPAEALEGNMAAALAAPVPESADVVALKPQSPAPMHVVSAASGAELVTLQQRIDALQREKQTLETAQQQLAGRLAGLQEELTRVRDDSREQILELEHLLTEVRREQATARADLQSAQEALAAQRASAGTARERAAVLEAELTERRAREEQLRGEIGRLQADLAEVEAVRLSEQERNAESASARAGLQARIAELETLAEHVETQRTQIADLENALRSATANSEQTATRHAEQAQRLNELEAALQATTTALEHANQAADQQLAELQTAHAQTHAVAGALQAQLDEAAARQAALEADLAAAGAQGQAAVAEQQSLCDAVAALEAELAAERDRFAAERVRAENDGAELAQLRDAQAAAAEQARAEIDQLQAELGAQGDALAAASAQRERVETALAEAGRQRTDLERQLREAQSRVESLQADSSTQVQQLHAELDALREQVRIAAAERAEFENLHAQLERERAAVQAALDTARTESETARAQTTAQILQLQTELQALREQAAASTDERTALVAAQAAWESEREALHLALDEARTQIDALQADAGEQLLQWQALLEESRTQLRGDAQARAAIAEELAAACAQATELEAALRAQTTTSQSLQERLHDTEQLRAAAVAGQEDLRRAQSADQATLADLRGQIDALQEDRHAADRQIGALEQHLAEVQTEAARFQRERQDTLAALQVESTAAAEARAEWARLQSDAASDQNEQAQQLVRLREELRSLQTRLHEADAARSEIEGRLAEMSDVAATARGLIEQNEQAHAQALVDAEQRVRVMLERQLEDLRSELDGARAALAREQSQRSNLEQARQTEFEAARARSIEHLQQTELALQERQQALVAAESARQALETQLSADRDAAAEQQQALLAELEQLRSVTSADLAAMQQRLGQLQEDLQAARRLGAGGSADEEIGRLRLLLDEAREAADAARAEAEQWREQASAMPARDDNAAHVNDELAAMHVQLADVQNRIAEALQGRDTAEQELALLRQNLQTQAGMSPVVAAQSETPQRRGSLWWGVVAGLVAGAMGTGAVWWFSGNASAPTTAPTSPAPREHAAQPASTAAPVAAPAAAPVADTPAAGMHQPLLVQGRVLHDTLTDGSRGPQLVEIAAAEFFMGSSANSLDFDERPRHPVKLRRFAIAQQEITFKEYDAFARATGRRLPDDKGWGRGRQPVIDVSWEDAAAYAHWLSEQTGQRYRLPTEAEWEYVGGGFAGSLYWWGNVPGEGRANCFNCGSAWDTQSPAPVGRFAANPLGVFDTAGNVAEWTQDCYHPGYDGAPDDGSAWVEVGCPRRVVRGGGFDSPANTLRTAKRDQQPANMRADDVGFRVVREF